MKPTTDLPARAVTIAEAGRLMGVSRSAAYVMAASGRLPVVRLGPRLTRVPVSALDALLAEAQAPAARSRR